MARKKTSRKKASRRRRHAHGLRPFWSGTISFGLVSVPVHLYPGNRSAGAGLRMLDKDGTPLARRYYCPEHGRDVHDEHILRGYRVEEEQYVVVTDEELQALEPRKSRDIDLRKFVERQQIPPLYFERSYILTPAGDSTKAYRLLAAAMERLDRAGVATFVMRGKEYLVAILAENGILRAQTLRFAAELRSPQDVGLPPATRPTRDKVDQFQRQIDELARSELALDEMQDDYAAQLRQLAEEKQRRGEDVVAAEAGTTGDDANADDGGPPHVDLLERIRASLAGRPDDAPQERTTHRRGDGAADQSKDALYERARKLRVPGRSQMTKRELIDALRKRSR